MTDADRLWQAALTAMQAWIIRGGMSHNSDRKFADETVAFAFDCAEKMLAEYRKRVPQ